MSWFRKLFRRDDVEDRSAPRWVERDNVATRHLTFSEANTWWLVNLMQDIGGFAVYTFKRGKHARNALLELDIVHVAEDTGKLVCTEPLVFGYYKRDDGVWEAEIAGKALTQDVWLKATESFTKHHGSEKAIREPQRESAEKKSAKVPSEVTFVREEKKPGALGGTWTYRIYEAGDAESARAFLEANSVDEPHLYLVVETPGGNFCRDQMGMYQE